MVAKKTYDWIIVGGGISGIAIAEILCRTGKSVLIIEKNKQLASETSKVFHEWLHSGALYSLMPDKLLTLRYLLGATDDLFEYYSDFPRMNMKPTESGTQISDSGWFNSEYIEYRYKKHSFNPIWSSLVSRSLNIIDLLNEHDWLRRRAGSDYGNSIVKPFHWFNYIYKQIDNSNDFFCKTSPDITINSRVLINDILSSALLNGLEVINDAPVDEVIENENMVSVKVKDIFYQSKNVVICSPEVSSKLLNIPIKTSYAPIAVVENVPKDEKSFVELDFRSKKCINLLIKGDGIGQAGGISLNEEKDIDSYLSYIISEHKKRNPGVKVIDTYIGLKKELVKPGNERNYLYHIDQYNSRTWSVVLGKFSLAFSMAPEFYRRVYHDNPPKMIDTSKVHKVREGLVSETSWKEIINNSRS